MSRKKKPTHPSVPASTGSPALAGPAGADAALAAARYREAIEHFKDLLKRERRPAWLLGLAAAYAGRAEQLAAKGMLKEALALWRTRSQACAVPLLGGPYVAWLLGSGQIEQALGLLATVDKLPPEAQAEARTQLAAAVLVAPEQLLGGLSVEQLHHRAAARAALAAYARGDEVAQAQALPAISYHSPYRDLRPLLKALALQASAPQQAAEALARVPENSPFEALAKALRVCLLPGTEWLAGLRSLGDAGRTLVLDLKGCPQHQRALVLELMQRQAEPAPSALELCDLLLRHPRALGDGVARPLCLRLLPHAPQRLGALQTRFLPLSAAERERVLALAAELKQRPDEAQDRWLRLVELLGATAAGQQRAALVLRRLADEHEQDHAGRGGKLCSHALAWLTQSLKLDPADRATHLRLVRDARVRGDLRQARSGLDAACKQFPQDAQLLQEAVEVALAAGSFKKAAGLAKQVLQVEPINPRVRTLIGQAHLAHARKQIGAHNLPAAHRELDEAASWLRGAGEHGLLKLLRGLATEPAAAGDALLREALAELGGALAGTLHLLLEGRRAKLEPGALVRRAGVDLAATPSAADVTALAQALNALAERDAAVPAALGVLSGMLRRAAGVLSFSESEHGLVCEALHRHGQPELTRHFAQAALKRWPQRPLFVYFEAAAQFGANPWSMPQREWQRLERVLDQAQAAGDQRTAARLGKLLDASGSGPPGGSMPPGGDEFDPDSMRAVLETMLALGGEDHFLAVARQQLGKATFEQLQREFKGSKKQFARALVEMMELDMPAPDPFRPVRIVPPAAGKPAARGRSPASKKQTDFFDD